MDEVIAAWLRKVGEKALRKLWAYANAEGTPTADRVKIWSFMAEMAFGKAGTMTPPTHEAKSYGVIVLPGVPGYDDDEELTV